MQIGVLGINHKSAEISRREQVAHACRSRLSRDCEMAERYHCVVLSTCNRTEIYFSSDNLAEAHSALLNVLRGEINIPFEHKLYSFFGFDCFMHLARVSSGLDSVIIAESEIKRQVRIAYEQTLLHYNLPSCMHFLFQKSLKLGKQIRSSFSLSQNQMTIPKILFQISESLFKKLADQSILFIGNSEINRKVIAYFKRKGVKKMTLCTRALLSAKAMAEKEELSLLPWERLSLWQEYPVVICGSNTPHAIINKTHEKLYCPRPKTLNWTEARQSQIEAVRSERRSPAPSGQGEKEDRFDKVAASPNSKFLAEDSINTRLIFDLSIPRNVDPCLSRHPQLLLLNIEELTILIEEKQEKNVLEINRAEILALEGVQRYHHAFCQKEKRLLECV